MCEPLYACMHACLYVCLSVCMCVHVCTHDKQIDDILSFEHLSLVLTDVNILDWHNKAKKAEA